MTLEISVPLVALLLGQLAVLCGILWKGGRWSASIETGLTALGAKIGEHVDGPFAELRARVRELERGAEDHGDNRGNHRPTARPY